MAEPGARALARWGSELRRARRRRRLRRRLSIGAFGLTLLLATIIAPPRPRLLWNASASAPIGLYAVEPYAPLAKGDLVVARLPVRHRLPAARRGYVPVSVPVVKRVAAIGGDEVCARGALVAINGGAAAERQARDGAGRPLPWWSGCRRLRRDELFLLTAGVPGSFDGRYFGVSRTADLLGRAEPLWPG